MRSWLRLLPLLLLCTLAACGGGSRLSGGPPPNYAAPGPAADPWGPYIREAASRFDVPERWIREVMRQESGGHEYLNGRPTTSDAGAMGLMQIMPSTYEELRGRYGLGDNPYDPRDNILAGAGYIRELYDKYGSPGFLAAYNAGPQRLEDYNAGRSDLPNETVNYVASIAPRLGNDRPMSGPLTVYASGAPVQMAQASGAGGCNLNAAYDPSAPCEPASAPEAVAAPAAVAPPVQVASASTAGCWHDPNLAYDPAAPCQAPPPARPPVLAPASPVVPPAPPVLVASAGFTAPRAACWHDPDAAYDPSAPCQAPPAPVRVAAAAFVPPRPNCWRPPGAAYDAPCETPPAAPPRAPVEVAEAPTTAGSVLWSKVLASPAYHAPAPPVRRRFALIPSAAAAEVRPAWSDARWGVQVGAFATPELARSVAESARARVPMLARSHPSIGTTAPFGGHVLYRARLTGLTAGEATSSCRALASRATACLTVPPGG